MMLKKIPFVLIALILFSAFKSDKPAYILFNQKGKAVKYKRMLEVAQNAEVVFFGELHNNPISHWLQYELTKDLSNSLGGKIILGAEMFEADNQIALSNYLNEVIDKDSLKKSARLWPNYKTDIEPLVEFARENKLPFVATNIPRRYASMVFRHGFESLDTLSADTKEFIAPLPIAYDPELPGYKSMLTMMGESVHGRSPENFPKAQAVKDATMAWFIHKNMEDGKTFIHFNGAYHSDNFEGILWYLQLLRPDVKIVTISTVETDQPIAIPAEKRGVANFIVAVPSTMTKTH
jgi:uncharacterized iron-regulated protein